VPEVLCRSAEEEGLMKCRWCGRPATYYVSLIIDGKGETDQADDYFCERDAALQPRKGDKLKGREVLENDTRRLP
jgi:hypothetical protein